MSEISREQLLMAVISGKGPAYLRGVDLSMLDLSNAGWLVEADLRQANLSHTILTRSDLRNTILERANLQEAKLAGANLEGANLANTKLITANLRYVNLRGANLSGANMVGANLYRANLDGANLEGADLEGANLEGADLNEAKLNNANLKNTNLIGVNLKSATLTGTLISKGTNGNSAGQGGEEGFVGSINSIQLYDLLQLVCLSRNNMLVKIKSDQKRGIIEIRNGRVCHAQSESASGEAALLEILAWSNGKFETQPLGEQVTCTIQKPLEQLILESVRRRDERFKNPDYLKEELLVHEIRTHTPIRTYPSRSLLHFLSESGKSINPTKEIQINDVFDSGETGGVMCAITTEEDEFIAPLKYIKIRRDHPLFNRIFEYVRSNGGPPQESGSSGLAGAQG
ncbi:MAG: pentapeptide repeat-containing protein [Syntrophobacteraceae bacterium]|nr:pentapeptide repeat-containing protein [Desulfobacteraceae bacterium]